MKNSNDQSQEASVIQHGHCSEKTCVTCFANSGCIYEQYAGAVINKMEEAYLAAQANDTNQQVSKRA